MFVILLFLIPHVNNIIALTAIRNSSRRNDNKQDSLKDLFASSSRESWMDSKSLPPMHSDELNEDDNIKAILEEKYKFQNDETSTRYKITKVDKAYPAFSEDHDRKVAMVFRSYAVRRIVGGMETSISMYPYNVAISRNGKHWCGGSIIDEQWVLTAGHCLEAAHDGNRKKLAPFIVRAGSSFHNHGGYQARVNKVFFPKEYVPGSADFDYSLLRLDRPMPIGRNIAVLNLPSKDYVIKEEDLLIVTGWGSTDESGYGHIPDRVRFVPVPVMTLQMCQKSYRFYITPRMLCAGYATGGKDACNHDSGGPAVRDGVLLGIVSFGGKKCGDPRSPGVYSRVSEITDWVETTIIHNEAYNVPELQEKINKARLREKELQNLKSEIIRTVPKVNELIYAVNRSFVERTKYLDDKLKKNLGKVLGSTESIGEDMDEFKARVEDKKNKIKNWLRETLKSPSFIKLAKAKLREAGFSVRKNFRRTDVAENEELLDDKTIDEINLQNQINERILHAGEDSANESETLLGTLALQEMMIGDATALRTGIEVEDLDNYDDSIETLISYITKN